MWRNILLVTAVQVVGVDVDTVKLPLAVNSCSHYDFAT
jgi:hypothetical protein